MNHGDGGGAQEEREEHVDMPHEDVDTPIKQEGVEQSPMESGLRRSSRPYQPSKRYPLDEYVMLNDSDEAEYYKVVVECQHKEG